LDAASMMHEAWLDEINTINKSETSQAVYCHKAEFIRMNPHDNMKQYSNVGIVLNNGVERVRKTFCMYDKENAEAEVYFLCKLEHPNINALVDVVIKNKRINLILVYCPHGDLHDYLQQQKSKGQIINPDIILLWMQQLLSALVYMHEKRIVHCDIKTKNVFVMHPQHLCIGDLGLAQNANADGVCENEVGTPYYQPPENCKDDPEPCSFASDVWGLGCVFFEAMTLYSIHLGWNASCALVHKNLVQPELQNTPYAENLRSVVTLCLQEDPHKRPSARALMDTLPCRE
jgi:serine/threonine protein kinase